MITRKNFQHHWLILSMTALLFVACHKHSDEPSTLSTDKSTLNETMAAGEDFIQVSSNTDWTITGMPAWLTLNPASGNGNSKVTITYQANAGTDARTATLVLNASGVSPVTLHVTQSGSAPSIMVDKLTANEKSEGQLDSIMITSNVPWSINVPATANWIVATPSSGAAGTTKVYLAISANTTANTKAASFTVNSTGATNATPVTIALTQAQPNVTISGFTAQAHAGDNITITGTGFSVTASDNHVTINGKAASVVSAIASSLVVTVPPKAGTGSIVVAVNTKTATSANIYTHIWTTTVSTLAGSTAGYHDGLGTNAQFDKPYGIAVDNSGNVYVGDEGNHRIRKITKTGVVSTFAGDGTANFHDAVGTDASFNILFGLAIDTIHNLLYVTDNGNHAIRKIDLTTVQVTTFAGTPRSSGFHDDNIGTNAQFYYPSDVTVGRDGSVYVSDAANNAIRKITSTGAVTTLAGRVTAGYNDAIGTNAAFNTPYGIGINYDGDVYVADLSNQRIRQITTPGGIVTTLAGNSAVGANDGQGTNATFSDPHSIAITNNGNIYIADFGNRKIRMITKGGLVSTIAGNGANGHADGPGATATFGNPTGIAADRDGDLYIVDQYYDQVRKITFE